MNQIEFIQKSSNIHNNKYDYSLINFTSRNNLVEIICPVHGIFEQVAGNHLQGKGCKYCAKNVKITKEIFIEKSKELHGNKYNYDNIEYIDRYKK